jgi:plasmid stabilization system protein ParE
MKLVLTVPFRDELRHEFQFIKVANPRAAEMVRTRIMQAVQRLKQFPESGRAWRRPGKWELVIPGIPYLVIYKLEEDEVVILSLFHTSRDAPHVQ